MSAPFVDQVFEFPQPDGSTVTLRGTGNQERARFQALDGTPMVRNAEGYFVEAPDAGLEGVAGGLEMTSALARRRSRWQQRRRDAKRENLAAAMLEAPPSRQTVGNFVGLTLLIEFSDAPGTIAKAEVEKFCNAPGYTGFGNNGSVFDYFRDVSGGKLKYTNVVAPYNRAKKPKSYYADPAQPFGKRAQELIREALAHHIAQGFNFAPLTADSHKFIYALNVFYAGPTVNAWGQGLWPHQSTLSPKVAIGGGRKFADYQITDMGSQLTLGTFCHENGHMICDFPDLYQYAGDGRGAGLYCLMCFGGTGANAKNPVHVGAYLKRGAGWGTAALAAPGTKTLTAGSNQFLIHRRSASEYYLIENRQRTGRDAGLPGAGLAIWHIDERASNTNPTGHYECALVQADNLQDLELGRNYGDTNDLFSSATKADFSKSTAPASKWYSGGVAGLEISQIGASGPTMTFKVG